MHKAIKTRSGHNIVVPTAEEDAQISAGIAADPDTYELSAAEFKQLRPLAASQPRVRLVHGDLDQANALASVLRAEGFIDVAIPQREDSASVA